MPDRKTKKIRPDNEFVDKLEVGSGRRDGNEFHLLIPEDLIDRPTRQDLQVNLKYQQGTRTQWGKNNLIGIPDERTLKVLRRLKKKQANKKK